MRILDNVYGDIYPGELCCILGESGSGKTSMLDILAGFQKSGVVRGTILVDEKPRPKDFKFRTGYFSFLFLYFYNRKLRAAV